MFKNLIYLYKRLFWSPIKLAKSNGVNIGVNCRIATRYFGSEPYLITIGDHVQITNGVKFSTHGGGWIYRTEDPKFDTFGKIIIKDNVYIGNNAMILPGVTIGCNVIIGAGTIITKSIPDNCIVAGNPGRIIGDINSLKQRLIQFNVRTKGLDYLTKKDFLLNLHENKFIKK